MPLEGNTREFGLADVIQFICNNQKDGVLLLAAGADTASVSFEQGKITGALYGRGGKTDQLSNYLRRSKRLDAAIMDRLQRLSTDSGLTLDEVMVKEGVMTGEEIQAIIAFKVQEVFDEIFTLPDADYRFDPDAKLYKKSKYQVALGPDMLLLEAMRRKDEWPAIRKALPTDAIELVKTARDVPPPAQETDDFLILMLLGSPRTVAALIEETGLGRFRTFSACYNLLQSGAAATTGQVAAQLRRQEAAGPGLGQRVGRTAMGVAAAGLALAMALGGLSLGRWAAERLGAGGPDVVRGVTVAAQMEGLENRIEVFRLVSGRLPVNLYEAGATAAMLNNFNYAADDSAGTYTLEVRK